MKRMEQFSTILSLLILLVLLSALNLHAAPETQEGWTTHPLPFYSIGCIQK